MDEQLCEFCKKPCIKYEQTISRWCNAAGKDCAALPECYSAIKTTGRCPVCKSHWGLKIPREGGVYCEDCEWPDEDFAETF